jgi:hypothetical protein
VVERGEELVVKEQVGEWGVEQNQDLGLPETVFAQSVAIRQYIP